MLSRSNPAESQELETYEGAPCVYPMRHTEHRDWPYQVLLLEKMGIVLMSNFLLDYTQKLCKYVVFCLYYMPETRQTYAGCKRCGLKDFCGIIQSNTLT